jgi:hypothetical protein
MAAFGSNTVSSINFQYSYGSYGFAVDPRWQQEEDEKRRKLIIRGDAYGSRLNPKKMEEDWKKALVLLENHANFQFFLWSRSSLPRPSPMRAKTDTREVIEHIRTIVLIC